MSTHRLSANKAAQNEPKVQNFFYMFIMVYVTYRTFLPINRFGAFRFLYIFKKVPVLCIFRPFETCS